MTTAILISSGLGFVLLVALIVYLLVLSKKTGGLQERLSSEVRDAAKTNSATEARRTAERRIATEPDRLRDDDGFRRD